MNTDIEIKTTLELNATEAIWLKGLVQNAQCDPCEESKEDREMRGRIFDAIPSFPELYHASTQYYREGDYEK